LARLDRNGRIDNVPRDEQDAPRSPEMPQFPGNSATMKNQGAA
jgi:hypothetical protein